MVAAGLPADVAAVATGWGASVRAGLLETPLGDTARLLGRAPTALEDFLAEALSAATA